MNPTKKSDKLCQRQFLESKARGPDQSRAETIRPEPSGLVPRSP
jgi:hypothetical protein